MSALRVCLVLTLALTIGCAGQHRMRPGGAAALIAIGALVTVTGVLVSAGCPDLSEDRGCGAAPADPNPQVGVPLIAAGATMIAVGASQRPRKLRNAQNAVPATPMPDPFVPPLSSP
jgi:hypothetical protein